MWLPAVEGILLQLERCVCAPQTARCRHMHSMPHVRQGQLYFQALQRFETAGRPRVCPVRDQVPAGHIHARQLFRGHVQCGQQRLQVCFFRVFAVLPGSVGDCFLLDRACTPCQPGEYMRSGKCTEDPSSATSPLDRVCRACSSCYPCEYKTAVCTGTDFYQSFGCAPCDPCPEVSIENMKNRCVYCDLIFILPGLVSQQAKH